MQPYHWVFLQKQSSITIWKHITVMTRQVVMQYRRLSMVGSEGCMKEVVRQEYIVAVYNFRTGRLQVFLMFPMLFGLPGSFKMASLVAQIVIQFLGYRLSAILYGLITSEFAKPHLLLIGAGEGFALPEMEE